MKNLILFGKTYGLPLGIFVFSRILIYFILLLVSTNSFGETRLDRWDSRHYLSIAENGYQFYGKYEGEGALIAFFPLYPFIIKLFHITLNLNFLDSALMASLLFGLGSAAILFKLVLDWKGRAAALTAVSLLSFYPFSFFLSAPYTESLFLFLVLLYFYFSRKKLILASGLVVSLACITRITGGILGLIFIWQLWKQTKSFQKTFSYSVLAGIPFFIFSYFQYAHYGTPFAFLLAQKINWHHSVVWPWFGLLAFLKDALSISNLSGMWRAEAVALFIIVITLLLSFKKIPRDIWLFGFGILFLTLSQTFILGMGRYLMLVLPFYFFGGYYLSNKKTTRELFLIASSCWMIFNTILFVLSKNIF